MNEKPSTLKHAPHAAALGRSPLLIALLATAGLLGCLFFLHVASGAPFPPYDIAEGVVALTPGSLATFAIEQLGVWAQRSLKLVGVGLVLLLGTGLGAWAAARTWRLPARIAALGGLPLAATLLLHALVPGRTPLGVLQIVLITALYLTWSAFVLWAAARDRRLAVPIATAAAGPVALADPTSGRRAFLAAIAAGTTGLVAAALAGAERLSAVRFSQTSLPEALPSPAQAARPGLPAQPSPPTSLPAAATAPAAALAAGAPPAETAAAAPASTAPAASEPALAPPAATPTLAPGAPLAPFVPAPGTRPNLTPLADFYVVDKAVVDPTPAAEQWRMAVTGLVDRPLTLTFDDLLALPRVDLYATLQCISNEVGGRLIGTTLWSGCRLVDVLARAGVQRQGVEVVVRCLDGYSESLSVDKANDPQTLLVYGMDGKLLEAAHGYPVRLLNPDHYGVKDPKWIKELEVVPEPYDGYWVRLGWDKDAFVKTTSVIDAPGQIKIEGGAAQMGGIAFAGWRGIAQVDVQIDGGEFRRAVLDRPLSGLSWVRWRYDWTDVTPGAHKVAVRATDGTGIEQESLRKPPHPDGASGWHTVSPRL